MDKDLSSNKTAIIPALIILLFVTTAYLLYRYQIARIVTICLLVFFFLFGLVCYLLYKYIKKHKNIPSWVNKLGIVPALSTHLLRSIITHLDSKKIKYSLGVTLILLLFNLVFLYILIQWDPFKDASWPMILLYITITGLSILITSNDFEDLINHKIFYNKKADYDANLVRKVIYMLYFVFLIVEAFSSIEQLTSTSQLRSWGLFRHSIVIPAFLTLIAYERAFRN